MPRLQYWRHCGVRRRKQVRDSEWDRITTGLKNQAQMEKRMERSLIYNGTITAEQFLFYEIRIASKLYLNGTTVENAIDEIKKDNLFQYPTERLVARISTIREIMPPNRVGEPKWRTALFYQRALLYGRPFVCVRGSERAGKSCFVAAAAVSRAVRRFTRRENRARCPGCFPSMNSRATQTAILPEPSFRRQKS